MVSSRDGHHGKEELQDPVITLRTTLMKSHINQIGSESTISSDLGQLESQEDQAESSPIRRNPDIGIRQDLSDCFLQPGRLTAKSFPASPKARPRRATLIKVSGVQLSVSLSGTANFSKTKGMRSEASNDRKR